MLGLLALAGCDASGSPLALRPVAPGDAVPVTGCAGGAPTRPLEHAQTLRAPGGWIRVEAVVGRCAGSDAPVDVRVEASGETLYEARLPPSEGPLERPLAWLAAPARGARITLTASGGGGARLFFRDVRGHSLPGRPAALPPGTIRLHAAAIAEDDGALRLTLPARLRVAVPEGVHTVDGAVGAGGPRQRFLVLQAESGRPPLVQWTSTAATDATPFAASWAQARPGPLELWATGPGEARLESVAVRSRGIAIDAPPAVERTAPEPTSGLALFALGEAPPSAPCGDHAVQRVAPGVTHTLRIPPGPRRVDGWLGVCAPTAPGTGRWRITDADGTERITVEHGWPAGESSFRPFSFTLPDSVVPRELDLAVEGPGGVALAWSAVRVALPVEAASASGFNESEAHRDYAPERAIDGDPATEWHALGGRGWIELALGAPREVRGVAIVNGFNPGYEDRALRRFVLEARRGDTVVAESHGAFEAFSTAPERLVIPLRAQGVDRIRLVVRSAFRLGAAVAELHVL